MSSKLQFDVCCLTWGQRYLVNAYEGKAGMVLFAGETVWSMSERFESMRAYTKMALYKYSSFPITSRYELKRICGWAAMLSSRPGDAAEPRNVRVQRTMRLHPQTGLHESQGPTVRPVRRVHRGRHRRRDRTRQGRRPLLTTTH